MILGRYEGRCKPQTRSPLLDHVPIETVARFPEFLKINGFTTKPHLLELGMWFRPMPRVGVRT